MTDLAALRRTAARALMVLAWVHVPVLVLICQLLGHDIWSVGMSALAFAALQGLKAPNWAVVLGLSAAGAAAFTWG